MEDYDKMLTIAKEDLEASKFLYERRLYPNSSFYLQQSVEKANKALAFFLKIGGFEEAKSVYHEPLKLSKIASFKYEEKIQEFEDVVKENPHIGILTESIKPDLDKIREGARSLTEMIDSIHNNKEKIFAAKEEDLERGIAHVSNELSKLEEEERRLRSSIPPEGFNEFLGILYNTQVQITLDKLTKHERENSQAPKLDLEKVNEAKEEAIAEIKSGEFEKEARHRSILNNMAVQTYSGLMFLAGITAAFSTSSRYPQESTEWKIPSEIYNLQLPVIRQFNNLFALHARLLGKFEELIEWQKKGKSS